MNVLLGIFVTATEKRTSGAYVKRITPLMKNGRMATMGSVCSIALWPKSTIDYINNRNNKYIPSTINRYRYSNMLPQNTFGCRYNKVQYHMIFHTALQLLRHCLNQSLYSQRPPITRPNAMGFLLWIFGTGDRVITAPRCIVAIHFPWLPVSWRET